MYKIKISKILFLTLDMAHFYRKKFFNTNDLAILSNRYKSDLVRLREDKADYKYLDDTRSGGLRGNLSTLLTLKGLVKRGSKIVNYYSIGKDGRLVNAMINGQIVLDRSDRSANTNDEKLKKLLEIEVWLFNVREAQAHVKNKLEKNTDIPLIRDSDNFKKQSVFKSNSGQMFIRSLINNFVDSNNKILQFSLINLWSGNKFKKKNLHPLLVVPTKEDPWKEIFAIKNEDLYENKPLFLNVNLENKSCEDLDGNKYQLYTLSEAIKCFSRENENIASRLNYNWKELQIKYCDKETDDEIRKEDEFSNFLKLFLDWNRHFFIDDKEVVDIIVISSGGPDVELIFSGGTKQKLELEHNWKNYLDHGHYKNSAFNNVWIFAEEEFDQNKIFKLFAEQKKENDGRIPDVFLCVDKEKNRHVYRIDWENKEVKELNLKFKV